MRPTALATAQRDLPSEDQSPAAVKAKPAQSWSGCIPDGPQVQPAPTSATAKPATQATVDVAAVLDGLASIVDLMKLLDLDSSAAARKRLAEELHYQGDMKNSAKMNVWLHKQVMIKLAENGGKVPEDLKH